MLDKFAGEPNPRPWANYPTTIYDQQKTDLSFGNPSGIWNWFNYNKMLATVVEKAKVIIFYYDKFIFNKILVTIKV